MSVGNVQIILDTVINELKNNPHRKFVYVEIAFFWRWWNLQDEQTKQEVRELVNQGRLEFVIGAWTMNDEAVTYYQDIIDQQTLGLQFILKEFGECARPKSAWQLDPFGHSREQASLFAQFGFDSLYLGRIDYQDDAYRSSSRTREFVWLGSDSLNASASSIFTSVLPNTYFPPPGVNFDIYSGDDPIIDSIDSDEYNVPSRVATFLKFVEEKLSAYSSNGGHMLITMGLDFQYSDALTWFKNLDKLIYHTNKLKSNGSKYNLFYSTPSCYAYALHRANLSWPTLNYDFFPYAHRPHAFWTGYFTSRTNLKSYVRRANNFYQAVRQMSAWAALNDQSTESALFKLARALAESQHHDAITGTEKQHVAYNYAKHLSIGVEMSVPIISKAYAKINSKAAAIVSEQQIYCPLLNISECVPIENENDFLVYLYNPIARYREHHTRIPLVSNDYVLSSYDAQLEDEPLDYDYFAISNEIMRIPERKSKAMYEIVFNAKLPPLGLKVFRLSRAAHSRMAKHNVYVERGRSTGFSVNNGFIRLDFDSNGALTSISHTDGSMSAKLSASLCYYNSFQGNNSVAEFHASGAYIFR
jgi:lysosomal alpha-mannosidase